MEYKKLTEKFGLWVLHKEDGLILDQAIIERFHELFTSQIWLSQDYADEWDSKPNTRLALVMDALSKAKQLMQQSHKEILGTAGVFQEPVWVVNKYPATSLPSPLLPALLLSNRCGRKPKNVFSPSECIGRHSCSTDDAPALVDPKSWDLPCKERNDAMKSKDSLLGCVRLFKPSWDYAAIAGSAYWSDVVVPCLNRAAPPLGEIVVVDPMQGHPVLKEENQGAALREVFTVLSWVSYVRLCRQQLNVHWNTARGTPAFPERDPLEFRHLTPNGYMPK
jgi:hypothetical protein